MSRSERMYAHRSRGKDMARRSFAVAAGVAVRLITVSVAGAIMRRSWPAYAAVADAMTFTVPMLLARLAISAVATLVAGFVTAAIVPQSLPARLMPGVLLFVGFIPVHIMLWDKFP